MLLIPVKQQLGLQAALKCCFRVVFCTLGSAAKITIRKQSLEGRGRELKDELCGCMKAQYKMN